MSVAHTDIEAVNDYFARNHGREVSVEDKIHVLHQASKRLKTLDQNNKTMRDRCNGIPLRPRQMKVRRTENELASTELIKTRGRLTVRKVLPNLKQELVTGIFNRHCSSKVHRMKTFDENSLMKDIIQVDNGRSVCASKNAASVMETLDRMNLVEAENCETSCKESLEGSASKDDPIDSFQPFSFNKKEKKEKSGDECVGEMSIITEDLVSDNLFDPFEFSTDSSVIYEQPALMDDQVSMYSSASDSSIPSSMIRF